MICEEAIVCLIGKGRLLDDLFREKSEAYCIMLAKSERIALFSDGINLYTAVKSLGLDIDYKRLLREFQSGGHLLRPFYYTAVFEDHESVSIRPLIDWLEYNGYTDVTKAAKDFVDHSGRRKVKSDMDIELAVDAMEIARYIDRMVLFSGDDDFRSLVQAVHRRGVRSSSPACRRSPQCAQELRRQADEFIDIKALQNKISRDPVQRPPPIARHHNVHGRCQSRGA